MRGILKWFKSGTRMKRWMLVIIVRNNTFMLWNSNNYRYERNISTKLNTNNYVISCRIHDGNSSG